MPTAKTSQQLIHDSLVAILAAAAASLAIDSRTPTVVAVMPSDRFSQKGLPLIMIGRPVELGDEAAGKDYRAKTFAVPVGFADGSGASEERAREAHERLGLLAEKTRGYLFGATAPRNWNLAFLHLYPSRCQWDLEDELKPWGKGGVILPATITVPVLIEAGKVWAV